MKDIKRYINNQYQIAGTRHYLLENGYAKGVSAIDAKTGSGLEYTVVCDRALDISLASYKGVNLTFISKTGETAPSFYDAEGNGWMKSFFGGLLTTCGPDNIGKACTVNGKKFAQHGSFSNTPAMRVADQSSIDSGINISGEIEFGVLGSCGIKVLRSIKSEIFGKEITVEDRVMNLGQNDTPLTLLYHTNYGYPLLSEKAELFAAASKIEPYDEYSKKDIKNVCRVSPPDIDNAEKNYFHYMTPRNGFNHAAVINREAGLGVAVSFSDNLPYLTHCKIERPGDYFMAVEPCNTLCLGREEIEKRGLLPYIKAGETKRFILKFTVLENSEIDEYIKKHFE
jgi:hypothetical protein